MSTYKQLIELNNKRKKENLTLEVSNNEALSDSDNASIDNGNNSSSRFNTLLSQARTMRTKKREEERAKNAEADNARLNSWFVDAQEAFSTADSYLSNTGYSSMLNKSNTITKTLDSINQQSVWVEQYLKKYEGTEDGAPLVSAFREYKNILNKYQSQADSQQEYAESFNDEAEYNNAFRELKYANYSYDDLKNELNKVDKASEDYEWLTNKSNEVATLEDVQKEYDALNAEYNELYNDRDETTAYNRLKEIEEIQEELEKEINAKKRQVSVKTSEEYNNSMLEKYGDYSYEQLFSEASKFDDTSDESKWLKSAGYAKATSEDLQSEYDKLKDEYNSLHISNYYSEDRQQKLGDSLNEYDFLNDTKGGIYDEVGDLRGDKKPSDEEEQLEEQLFNQIKEIENEISKKKQEERVTEFYNLDKETQDIISAKGNINYYSPYNWFGGDENTKKIEEAFDNLDMSEEDKNKHLETLTRIADNENAKRQHQVRQEAAEINPFVASLVSVAENTFGAIPDAFRYLGAKFDKDVLGGDGYIDPLTTNVSKAQAVRETISEDIGGGIGSFLYNTGMSIADFAALLPLNYVTQGKASAIGEAASLGIMGTSAGVSSANTVIENGGSLDSAVSTGIAAGVAEAFFEKFSLDQLKAFKVSGADSVKSAILKNAFVEGSEEVATDIANAITDQLINSDMSQLSLQYQSYIEQGYTEEEAWKMCATDFGVQVGQSFAGGAISGGVLSSGAAGLNYATNKIGNSNVVVNNEVGKAVKESGNVNSLIETAKNLSPDSKAYKLAVDLESKQQNNKKVSSSKVGQLRNLIIEQSNAEYDAEYKKITENLLDEEKVVVDKLLNGEALTSNEVKIVNNNDVLKNNVSALRKTFNNSYSATVTAVEAPFEAIKSIDDNTDEIDESTLGVSENGKTKVNGEIYDGAMEIVRTNPLTDTVTYKIEKDGEAIEVNSEDIEFKTKEEAKLNALASKYNVKTAQKFFDVYESGQDVNEYSQEFNLYQNYGRLAVPLDSEKLTSGYLLSDSQKTAAYEAGLTSRKSYYQEQNIISSNAKNSKYYAYTKGNFNASAIKGVQLDETQKAFYNFFREFALRTGINVELFSSKEVSGKYQGEQGSWNKNTKTLRIDINAGLTSVNERAEIKHGMLNTFAHELTHIAEQSGFYDELHEAIVTALEKHGTDFNKLVEAKKDKIRNDSNAKTMSDEELTYLADAEVIADSCETMLKDSKIFEDIAQGNPTLAQKIKAKLKNFIERLKQLLKKTDALTYEGKLLEECVSELENIQKLWDKAVTSGIKTTNAINAKQKNNTADNGVKYSIRDNFYKEYDNWDKKNTRIVFNIGTTSKALQSIGLSKQKITWDSSKIIKIKAKHTEMTDSIIKQVPDIIENPIVIMKSKSQDSRITLFGEVFSNNKPILVIIELSPQNKKGIILNELKIASAYGKDNAQNLINTSSVLYIESNKKRVRNWEKRTGLQLPVGSSLSNSNNIISTSTANVNKNKKISMRNSAYLEAVENNDLETAQRLVEEAAKES